LSYKSVDALQRTLADSVFQYAADRKKAAGRALGTLVEIITYYTLRAWGFRDNVAIERPLAEFGNPGITHNVEFSLHPIIWRARGSLEKTSIPITTSKLRTLFPMCDDAIAGAGSSNNPLLPAGGIVRNGCVVGEGLSGPVIASLDGAASSQLSATLCYVHRHPFAIVECKRVGVEEGMRKGPQTIEKAKQGAYVARTVSSLQKVRARDGKMYGVIERATGELYSKPYDGMLREVIETTDSDLLRGFILTIGVVSNHGNWFTADNHNKELKVLAQSYDWLLFLTDAGLGQFIQELLLEPEPKLKAAREAFLSSYTGEAGKTRFTKVQMDAGADEALRRYFSTNEALVESWFNVIAPAASSLGRLHEDLRRLGEKDWKEILA